MPRLLLVLRRNGVQIDLNINTDDNVGVSDQY